MRGRGGVVGVWLCAVASRAWRTARRTRARTAHTWQPITSPLTHLPELAHERQSGVVARRQRQAPACLYVSHLLLQQPAAALRCHLGRRLVPAARLEHARACAGGARERVMHGQ
jgi:hypothetical protein